MSLIINGGGIIGSILALALNELTQGSLQISIIEQYSPYSSNCIAFQKTPRVIALSRGAYFELMKINIGSILSNNSTAIDQIEISEYGKFNKIFIKAQDYQLPELGYVVELYSFRKQLFDLLSTKPTITIYCPATIKYIKREQCHNIVLLDTGKEIISKLIVAADGSCSKLATHCGIQWFCWNYKQIAVTTDITTEISNFGQAFERFTNFGSLALLPISSNLSFLIWCVSNQKHKEILEWHNNKFIQELQNIFGWKLGKILNINTRYFYDLWLTYAKNHISHRLVLVGNAAQNLHPIAGQGFNLGIRDVITLVQVIYQALCDDVDIGSYSVLNVYQHRRRLDQYKTIIMTDGLIRLFGSRYIPLIIIRNLGLFLGGYNSFFKNLLLQSLLSWKLK